MSLIQKFYKILTAKKDSNNAVSAVEKLKNDNFFDSSLWFTKYPAISNLEKNFNIIDKKLKQKTKYNGFDYVDSPEYAELKEYILNSFDSYFKRFKLRSYKVEEFLSDQNSDDLFLLMHDLIHQVFQRYFVESIEAQSFSQDDDPGYYIPIMDRLYEDAASSLSNFQPKNSTQGLFTYLEDLFRIYGSNYEASEENLKSLIHEVFNIAKKELRSQSDNRFKQFADGFLSKLKGEMLNRAGKIAKLVKEDLSEVWSYYNLQEEYQSEYYERLDSHDLLDEEKAVILRNWLMGCIKKANEVLNKDYYNSEDID